jgi:hypothetical protein
VAIESEGLGCGQFAEGLSWEQVVGQMDDEQLAAAFQVGVYAAYKVWH